MRAVVPLLALIAACSSDKGDAPIDTDATDEPPEVETADTATDPEPDYTDKAGSIAIVHWAADVYNADEYFAVGIFVDDDYGVDNLASCLLAAGMCVDEYPAVGDPGAEAASVAIYSNLTYEVGELQAGEVAFEVNNSYGLPLYFGYPADLGGPGGISLDGEYAPYAGTDDYVVPDEIELTSPDPSVVVEAVPGGTIDLAWTSPGAGGVYLEVLSTLDPLVDDTVTRLDDDGSHAVDIDALQFRAPFDTKVLLLSRIETSEVDAAGNTIQVQARSDQFIYVTYENTVGWTELVTGLVGETCDDALLLPAVGAGQYYGDLATFADDHDLGDGNPVTGYGTAGLDAVLPVALTAGQTLTATFVQSYDGSIYLLDDTCDLGDALDGSDSTFDGEEEEFSFTATADGTYYLVLDAWTADAGSPYSLVLEIL